MYDLLYLYSNTKTLTMKNLSILFSFLLIFSIPIQLLSQESDLSNNEKTDDFSPGWAIGIKASTLGFGGEIVKSFNESFNLRLGGSYFKQKYSLSFADAIADDSWTYTTVGSVSLIMDWHFSRVVHLSAGVLYNMSVLKVESLPTESQNIGDIEVTPETIGTLTYQLTPNEICPYFGIGFGRSISKNKVVSFNFDLGAVYQGSPKVSLEATGMVSPTANEEQRKLLEDNVKDLRFFPFLNFQLSFKIF